MKTKHMLLGGAALAAVAYFIFRKKKSEDFSQPMPEVLAQPIVAIEDEAEEVPGIVAEKPAMPVTTPLNVTDAVVAAKLKPPIPVPVAPPTEKERALMAEAVPQKQVPLLTRVKDAHGQKRCYREFRGKSLGKADNNFLKELRKVCAAVGGDFDVAMSGSRKNLIYHPSCCPKGKKPKGYGTVSVGKRPLPPVSKLTPPLRQAALMKKVSQIGVKQAKPSPFDLFSRQNESPTESFIRKMF